MTTTIPNPATRRPPRWCRTGLLPGPFETITWPEADEARDRHEDAVAALMAASTDKARREALAAVCDAVENAVAVIREGIDAAEDRWSAEHRKMRPGGDRLLSQAELAEQRARVRRMRDGIDHDLKALRAARQFVVADTFPTADGTTLEPSVLVAAKTARQTGLA